MTTPDVQALQRHLAAARERIGAGDRAGALEEIDAALALDPEFAAAHAFREETVPPDPSEAAEFDLDLQCEPPRSDPSVPAGSVPSAQQSRPLVAPGHTLPSGVSAQGWAEFEQRVIRRRVDRRLQVTRAAIAGKRAREAREALDEVRELDPEHADLGVLRHQIEALAPVVAAGEAQARSGPRLIGVMVFGAVILAASWLGSPGGLRYIVWESASPRDTGPSVSAVTGPVSEVAEEAARELGSAASVDTAVTQAADELAEVALDEKVVPPLTQPSLPPEASRSQSLVPEQVAGSQPAVRAALERAGRLTLPVGPVVPPPPPTENRTRSVAPIDEPSVTAASRAAEPRAAEPRGPEPRAAEPRGPEPRAADSTSPPRVVTEEDAPIEIAKAEPSRAAPDTAPTSAELPQTVDDEALVKGTLQAYRHAYDGLDVISAQKVWPAVDSMALARAFHNLASQRLTFDACDVRLQGPAARAVCRGSARYVPKMGNRTTRVEPRVWSFTLRKTGEAWTIETARADRNE